MPSILPGPGQLWEIPRIIARAAVLVLLAAVIGLPAGCHRLPRPWDPDLRLPAGFRSPEQTFQTWRQATLERDRQRIRACYWEGLDSEELDAWLAENLRPEAAELLGRARWDGLSPVSPVEVNFRFHSQDGTEFRGVMVRTGQGWRIQSW